MAKKNKDKVTVTSNYSIVKFCAFAGLLLAGVAGLTSFIIWLLGLIGVTITWANTACNICNLVSQIALFITVWLAAWDFVKHRQKAWKIVYFVFLALGILGLCGFTTFITI
ncbi:MAG: hypothetical protein ACI4MN_04900 [Candidatus Coproplasma sp.]